MSYEERSSADSAAIMLEKAQRFIMTLHPPQRDTTLGNEYALYQFSDIRRTSFDYFAPSSQFTLGLPLRYMNPRQREAALDLLAASLSPTGVAQVRQITLLENVLEMRERKDPLFVRDPLAYYVAIFGTPDATGAWSWRFQGHHVALHWTVLDNEIISTTPQFIGAQPLEVLSTDWTSAELPASTRVIGQAEDAARTLIASLTSEQLPYAHIGIPWDLETTNAERVRYERRPNRFENRGIAYDSLTEAQQVKLKTLVDVHSAYQLPTVAKRRLQRIEDAGWNGVKFAFNINSPVGDAMYYRIRSTSFLVEYLNKAFTAPELSADHQHSVWRDFDNDWGLDRLNS